MFFTSDAILGAQVQGSLQNMPCRAFKLSCLRIFKHANAKLCLFSSQIGYTLRLDADYINIFLLPFNQLYQNNMTICSVMITLLT